MYINHREEEYKIKTSKRNKYQVGHWTGHSFLIDSLNSDRSKAEIITHLKKVNNDETKIILISSFSSI